MSNKNDKRTYTMRARARRQEEVHLRITKAAVELHGSVGPARTTVSDVAKLAGVRRATVYNHFPTDVELFDACSSHWFGEHPPPDPSGWARIADPALRVSVALEGMYCYYDRGRDMLGNVLRDTPLVAAVEEILKQKWWPLMEGMVEALAEGWSSGTGVQEAKAGERADSGVRASLRVALDFFTWQTLAAAGLSNEEAARLALAWIEAAAGQERRSSNATPNGDTI